MVRRFDSNTREFYNLVNKTVLEIEGQLLNVKIAADATKLREKKKELQTAAKDLKKRFYINQRNKSLEKADKLINMANSYNLSSIVKE
jgi:ribosomal protein L28